MDPQFDLQGGRTWTLMVLDAPPFFDDVCRYWYDFHYVNLHLAKKSLYDILDLSYNEQDEKTYATSSDYSKKTPAYQW
jgi:hypothetical protein